jgi:hypothetical protein
MLGANHLARGLLCSACILAFSTAVQAQEPAIDEIRAVWQQCASLVEKAPDDWLGWRRNHGGGYGDELQFWDGRGDKKVSVLKDRYFIDGIAVETDTSCYRPNGTLAFILSEMVAPNMASQPIDYGRSITREGRLYYLQSGKLLRVTQQIVSDGKRVADEENDNYRLAKGCANLVVRPKLSEVDSEMLSELGDQYGKRPAHEVTRFAWC